MSCSSPGPRRGPGLEHDNIRCENLALYTTDCVSLCLSDDTLKAVGPVYLVSTYGYNGTGTMPGEVKDPTHRG